MVKAVEKKRVANTKAAALGGGRGCGWEEREKKTHLGAMAAGAEGAALQGRDPPQGEGERERGGCRFEICLVLSVWFEEEGEGKLRACLEWRLFIGILEKVDFYSLMTSCAVWNIGTHAANSREKDCVAHRTKEIKHPVRAVVSDRARKPEANLSCYVERERAYGGYVVVDRQEMKYNQEDKINQGRSCFDL